MPGSSFPNFAGKHAEEPVFTAAEFVRYLKEVGHLSDYQRPTAGVVLCYQRRLYDHVIAAEGLDPQPFGGSLRSLRLLPSTEGKVGILGQFGIGAPAAAAVMEELAAAGTEAFISVGTAGGVQRDLSAGDLVLCEAAIRDEGVSHHYLPPARTVAASPALTAALAEAMTSAGLKYRLGTSWTIDTPYRETVAEVRQYQADGVLCVEMEAAALFAVGERLGLRVASAFTISDSVAELSWSPMFHAQALGAGLVGLYEAAVRALQTV